MAQRRHLLAAGAAALASPRLASAQAGPPAWPTRPVTLIVPWAAGGGADTVARILAQGLERELNQPVNVVNRTGGGGVTGHSAIATAAPDGYTIGIGTAEFTTFRVLGQAELGPDNFDLLSRISVIPAGVTVQAQAPWADMRAFAAALREAGSGRITGSGVGTGGSWHLAAAGLCRALGLEAGRIRWVPSQGGAPALQDLVAGGIGVFTGSPIEAQSLAAAGRVRVLATMGDARLSTMPEVPTLREAGIDWGFQNWFCLLLPRGVPAPVRAAVLAAAERAHARPDVRDLLLARGIQPVWDGPEAFARFVATYAETAAGLLRELGLVKA